MKNDKTPAIRFKGFTEAWEQRRLGDLGIFTSGTSIESEFSNLGKYKVISIGSYSENSTYNDQGIRAVESDKTKKKVLNKGDLTMILNDKTSSGNIIGRVLLIEKSDVYVYNQRTERIELDGKIYDSLFVYELLNAPIIRNKIVKQAQGNTQIYVNWSIISNTKYFIPKKAEQLKLSRFLYSIDTLITLHQRKCDVLMNIKKSLLEKMFPTNGDDKPRIRFKGFTEAWEQRKLGDIGKTFTGLSGKTANDFGHGEAKFLPYLNIFNNPIADINFLETIEIDSSQNRIQYGDVFFTTSSETPEEVGMSSIWLGNSDNIYLNSFCFGFRPNIEIDPYYLGYYLRSNSFRKKITILAQGISRFNISKNKVLELSIDLPSLKEQKLIGQYFKDLDQSITLHQRKEKS